jgi:RNA-binding protein YhbY
MRHIYFYYFFSALQNIEGLVESIITSVATILGDSKEVKIKVRIGIFTLLKELVQTVNTSLGSYLHLLVNGIQSALTVSKQKKSFFYENITHHLI